MDVRDTEIYRTSAPDPFRLLLRLRQALGYRYRESTDFVGVTGKRPGPWHPAAWLVPDGKILWLTYGARWAARKKPERGADVVLSTIPPPTAAVLGATVAKRWDVPHIVDYRDPWSDDTCMPRRSWPFRNLDRMLERQIVASAKAVVVVPGIRDCLPGTDTPVHLIPNGYDEEDFRGVKPKPPAEGFVIAHVGVLGEFRHLGPLPEALRNLAGRVSEGVAKLHFVQIGRTDLFVRRQLDALAARVRVSVLPSVPHHEAIAYMMGADLLYLPTIHNYIPAKTYEYVRTGVPILGVGARASNLAKLLIDTDTGRVFDHIDVAGIADYMHDLIRRPRRGPSPPSAAVTAYSREANARRLAELLDQVVETRAARSG